ncbi:MAG: DUF4388 domain-containing protein [bacterium]|nr:DUF4388 domain-containing protein [bacterium]
MAFKGTLKEFKVPDILQLISLQKKTGILTFTSTDGFITLIFETGLIVGVDAFPKKLEVRVGSVLVNQDFISDEMLQRALVIQKRTNQKIGEILIGMGLVDKDTIKESLKTQAVEIVLSLFKWKKGEYNFKVQDYLDQGMRIIDPIQTDNLIMEGVQMLDEWPLIKERVPDESIVFEPVPVDSKAIEIVDEYDESQTNKEKIYLNETEANLLKYINGENSVRELVELGVFTEYKVYKSLFNLIKKSIIRAKVKVVSDDSVEEIMHEELKLRADLTIKVLYKVLAVIIFLVFLLTFFSPLKPFSSGDILGQEQLVSHSGGSAADKPK